MEFIFCIVCSAATAYALALAGREIMRRRRLWEGVRGAERSTAIALVRIASWLGMHAEGLARRCGRSLRSRSLEKKLLSAGLDPAAAPGFLVLQLLVAALCALICISIFESHRMVVGFVCAVSGWFVVTNMLARRARQRRESIERALPFALDLLTLCVEAGSDLSQAIFRVAARLRAGPLAEEFKSLEAAIRIGTPRREALAGMGQRVGLPALSSLVALIIQADKLGAGVGPVLRAASSRMRAARFAHAERRGAAAAQKALLPLITCIMPAAFIIIFGPVFVKVATGGIKALL